MRGWASTRRHGTAAFQRATRCCWSVRSNNCSCRPGRCTGSCAWPVPSPTWRAATTSAPPTSPRRWGTGSLIGGRDEGGAARYDGALAHRSARLESLEAIDLRLLGFALLVLAGVASSLLARLFGAPLLLVFLLLGLAPIGRASGGG